MEEEVLMTALGVLYTVITTFAVGVILGVLYAAWQLRKWSPPDDEG